ncbi:hypothetical protein BGX34_009355 [Mortierella sp. NVP85]|nr:hypothetical protein BGX34_009355 [Mortierella sp. NVP85]
MTQLSNMFSAFSAWFASDLDEGYITSWVKCGGTIREFSEADIAFVSEQSIFGSGSHKPAMLAPVTTGALTGFHLPWLDSITNKKRVSFDRYKSVFPALERFDSATQDGNLTFGIEALNSNKVLTFTAKSMPLHQPEEEIADLSVSDASIPPAILASLAENANQSTKSPTQQASGSSPCGRNSADEDERESVEREPSAAKDRPDPTRDVETPAPTPSVIVLSSASLSSSQSMEAPSTSALPKRPLETTAPSTPRKKRQLPITVQRVISGSEEEDATESRPRSVDTEPLPPAREVSCSPLAPAQPVRISESETPKGPPRFRAESYLDRIVAQMDEGEPTVTNTEAQLQLIDIQSTNVTLRKKKAARSQ